MKKRFPLSKTAGLCLVVFLASAQLRAQDKFEFGDAPEGVIAYPSTGLIGQFPTCMTVGPSGFILHNNFGAFFRTVDFETDGNAGQCPIFVSYDADECFNDGDAGLLFPDPYTINILTNQVVPCPNGQGTSLGAPCTQAFWGQNVDILVQNMMPNNTVGYVNVLFDWDRNGMWGGTSPCPNGQLAPEHVLINFPIPNGFAGPLSLLGPGPFLIGPSNGYFWSRFSITEQPVVVPWDGSGMFEDGESEDYLLAVTGSIGTGEPDGLGITIPFRVVPNPAQDRIRIEFGLTDAVEARIELLGLDGRVLAVLHDAALPKGTETAMFQLPPLPNGLYQVRVRTANGAWGYQKLVLQR